MKKSIFYFLAVLFTASVCLGFTSCDDDDDDNEGPISTDGKISGKLQLVEEEWDEEADEYVYKLVGPVTDEVDEVEFTLYDYEEDEHYSYGKYSVSNGNFTASLETPSSKHLYPLTEDAPKGIKISDESAKTASICCFNPLKKNKEVGYVEYESLDGSTWATFVYVDKKVSITGSYSEIEEDDDITYKWEYNAQLKKGWNIIVGTSKISNEGKTRTYKMTANNTPSNLVWKTMLYNNAAQSSKLRSNEANHAFGIFRK